jgi:hypothetical protein
LLLWRFPSEKRSANTWSPAARCANPDDLQGRIWFLDIARWTFKATCKIARAETRACTMHNFNFIPLTNGRKVLISSRQP